MSIFFKVTEFLNQNFRKNKGFTPYDIFVDNKQVHTDDSYSLSYDLFYDKKQDIIINEKFGAFVCNINRMASIDSQVEDIHTKCDNLKEKTGLITLLRLGDPIDLDDKSGVVSKCKLSTLSGVYVSNWEDVISAETEANLGNIDNMEP